MGRKDGYGGNIMQGCRLQVWMPSRALASSLHPRGQAITTPGDETMRHEIDTRPSRNPLPGLLPLAAAVLALAALLSVGPTPARAQPDADAAQFLQQTEELLQDLAPLVRESESERARRLFDEAIGKQARARLLLRQGRPLFAVQISRAARETALQAERLARAALTFEQRARNYLERLRDLHDEVSDRAREAGNEQALRFVRQAEQLMRRSREQYQQTHYREAFRLVQAAEQQLRRAARLLFEQGGTERLERDLERTADLIASARAEVGDRTDPAVGDLLERAEQDLQRAREALARGENLRCLRFARLAREQVRRVLRQTGGRPDAAAVREQIERFDQRQGELVEQVRAAGDEQARRRLAEAGRLRDEAARALDAGRRQEALRAIRAALNLQNRVRDLLR